MANKDLDKKFPACFGELETVFPKCRNGLRNTPEACLACRRKTECLRAAMESAGGLKVREEFVDRAYTSGTIGFMERWLKKKDIQHRLEKKIKGGR